MFNKSVSWVRVRDDHILTVDQITFIADERFHAYHATENSGQSSISSQSSNQRRQMTGITTQPSNAQKIAANNDSTNAPWTLQIKYVQARDAGLYECQISAEPKISARVYLHVVGKLKAISITTESLFVWVSRDLDLTEISIFPSFSLVLFSLICSAENGANRRYRTLC